MFLNKASVFIASDDIFESYIWAGRCVSALLLEGKEAASSGFLAGPGGFQVVGFIGV